MFQKHLEDSFLFLLQQLIFSLIPESGGSFLFTQPLIQITVGFLNYLLYVHSIRHIHPPSLPQCMCPYRIYVCFDKTSVKQTEKSKLIALGFFKKEYKHHLNRSALSYIHIRKQKAIWLIGLRLYSPLALSALKASA